MAKWSGVDAVLGGRGAAIAERVRAGKLGAAYLPIRMKEDYILDDEPGLGLLEAEALSEEAGEAIAEAARWGRYALYLFLLYVACAVGSFLYGLYDSGGIAYAVRRLFERGKGILFIVPVVMLLATIYPVVKFWSFSHAMPEAISAASQVRFMRRVDQFRQMMKYTGVVSTAVVAIVLAFAAIAAAAILSRS